MVTAATGIVGAAYRGLPEAEGSERPGHNASAGSHRHRAARPMTRMHFVSAHFGGPAPWTHQIHSSSVEVSTAYYTDANTPSRHNAMTPRLKSKIPKMLEWQSVDADWYVWMDSSLKIKPDLVDLPRMILEIAQNNPLCFFRHSAGTTIRDEIKRVLFSIEQGHQYLIKRYGGEPLLEQLIHYYGDPGFIDNQLLAGTFFAYHRSAAPMMLEWFHHNVIWSIQDQISLPYVLQKSGLKHSLFEGLVNAGNPYFSWHWQEREQNLKA